MTRQKKEYTPKEKEEFKEQTKQRIKDFSADVCRKLVDTVAAGATEKFERPWKNVSAGLPHNPKSGHFFSGGNALALFAYMMKTGTPDPRFCTFKQAKTLGEDVHVKRGEVGITIMRPIIIRPDSDNQGQGGNSNEENHEIVLFRSAKVFHASQIANMPELKLENPLETRGWNNNTAVEALVAASRVPVTHGFNTAAYFPGRDVVRMPDKNAFDEQGEYYATLLHEWMHATGHESREGRTTGLTKQFSGLREYAKEELCAETFSAMASMALGIPYKMTTGAEYIKHWNEQIDIEPKEIFKQAVAATKILGVVVDFIQGNQPKVDWFPSKNTWPEVEDIDVLETMMGFAKEDALMFGDDEDMFAELDLMDFESDDKDEISFGPGV